MNVCETVNCVGIDVSKGKSKTIKTCINSGELFATTIPAQIDIDKRQPRLYNGFRSMRE